MDPADVKFRIDYPAAALLAAYLFYDRSGTALWVMAGAIIHELGHLAAIWLLGQRLKGVRICPFAVRIEKTRGNAAQEMAVSLAGPLAGALVAGVFGACGWMRGAAASLVLTVFNLLPVYPLDGWRLLDLLLEPHVPPQTARKIKIAAGVLALAAITVLLFWQALG